MLLPLKLYIACVLYAVSFAPGQGLTADGAAFRASNAPVCCLKQLQQFAVDLVCTVDLQPPSRECAVSSKVVYQVWSPCSAAAHIKLCMHDAVVRAICVSCMQVLTVCDVRKNTAWSTCGRLCPRATQDVTVPNVVRYTSTFLHAALSFGCKPHKASCTTYALLIWKIPYHAMSCAWSRLACLSRSPFAHLPVCGYVCLCVLGLPIVLVSTCTFVFDLDSFWCVSLLSCICQQGTTLAWHQCLRQNYKMLGQIVSLKRSDGSAFKQLRCLLLCIHNRHITCVGFFLFLLFFLNLLRGMLYDSLGPLVQWSWLAQTTFEMQRMIE